MNPLAPSKLQTHMPLESAITCSAFGACALGCIFPLPRNSDLSVATAQTLAYVAEYGCNRLCAVQGINSPICPPTRNSGHSAATAQTLARVAEYGCNRLCAAQGINSLIYPLPRNSDLSAATAQTQAYARVLDGQVHMRTRARRSKDLGTAKNFRHAPTSAQLRAHACSTLDALRPGTYAHACSTLDGLRIAGKTVTRHEVDTLYALRSTLYA